MSVLVIGGKRQRRLSDLDAVAISAHFAAVHGTSASKDTVSWITDAVV